MIPVQCGLRRGRTEFGNSVRAGQDIVYYVVVSLIMLVVLWLNRDDTLPGTDVPVALFFLPGLLALQIVFSGAYGMATQLATEREDGTLLRLKSVPGGMTGYVVGQMVRTTLESTFSMVILLIPASFFINGLSANGITGWMEAIGYLLLGLLAVLPLGFIVMTLAEDQVAVPFHVAMMRCGLRTVTVDVQLLMFVFARMVTVPLKRSFHFWPSE
jgi:ABC-2 type transport system permease protein